MDVKGERGTKKKRDKSNINSNSWECVSYLLTRNKPTQTVSGRSTYFIECTDRLLAKYKREIRVEIYISCHLYLSTKHLPSRFRIEISSLQQPSVT